MIHQSDNAMPDDAMSDDAMFRRQLDRLVDGELTAENYREFLASLEDRVDGWRDCALAFLESQAFEKSFADVSASPPAKSVASLQKPDPHNSSSTAHSWIGVLAVVASLFLGLGLGALTVGAFKYDWLNLEAKQPPTITPMITKGDDPIDKSTTDKVNRNAIAENGAAQSPAQSIHQTAYHSGAPQLRGDLRMQVGGEELLLPVYDAEGYDPQWLENPPSDVPDAYLQQLRDRGHQVEHRRVLATIPLENGDFVVAPVEQVQVTPVNLEWQ